MVVMVRFLTVHIATGAQYCVAPRYSHHMVRVEGIEPTRVRDYGFTDRAAYFNSIYPLGCWEKLTPETS